MANALQEEFLKLEDGSRMGALLDLVKVCPSQQQLLFLEILQQHLHRDFISLLPDQLVENVLSYLTAADAINCTLVSKNWNKVIGGCSKFWLQRAQDLGLSAFFITDELKKGGPRGVKELCAAAVIHQRYIRSLMSHSMVIAKSPCSADTVYQYAGNGIALRYRESNGEAQVVVERIVTPHSVVEIAVFTVKSFSSRIKWVSSSGSYILWKQLDGKWSGCDTTGLSLELEQWVDEPVSQGFHSISFCHRCHLIAILSEAEDDVEVWDLQVIKLQRGKSTVRKMVYPLPLDRVQSAWEKKRHFLGGDVTLLSDSEKVDGNGFCQSHRVLLQVDSKLVLHQLKSMPVAERVLLINHLLPDAKLSKPLHVISPHASEKQLDMMDLQVSKGRPTFCYSSNYSRVALLHESYLYVWHLRCLEAESCVDLLQYNMPSDSKCVALGDMYTVLASDIHGTCYVVVTRTGELLTQTSSVPYFNPGAQRSTRFKFFPPIDQSWLNSFNYADFWPLALMFDYFNSTENPTVEQELKALVGMRSHTKPSWPGDITQLR